MSASACALGMLLSSAALGWILPGERVLAQIVEARRGHGPLRVELRLRGPDPGWPARITLELHPDFGVAARDERGGRWVLRDGQVLGPGTAPAWLPDLDVLALRSEPGLRAWLRQHGVDVQRNELGRCGDSDCFVLGGRDSRGQLWVDKDRLEVVRWMGGSRRRVELRAYRVWDKVRFPSEIEVLDHMGEFASMTVERLSAARDLGAADFEP